MVAQASARQNRAPLGLIPSRRSSLEIGDTDEKATEAKPASKHIRVNVTRERARENTSIESDSPTMGKCLHIADDLPSGCARAAPALAAFVSSPRAAPSPDPSALPPIAARSLCASTPSSTNTPCATHSLPPGVNTRANSASEAGIDHARFRTLLMYTRSKDPSSMQAWERFSGIAGKKRR